MFGFIFMPGEHWCLVHLGPLRGNGQAGCVRGEAGNQSYDWGQGNVIFRTGHLALPYLNIAH